jgi:hypothetical protein
VSRVPVVLLAGLSLFMSMHVDAAKRPPCAGDRFVVQGGPLLPGAPNSQVDVITLVAQPPDADLGVGCGSANLKRPARLRASKRGTKVRVIWSQCAGFPGNVLLNGLLVEDCGRLRATLRAKGFKRTLDALSSTCGDGFVDAVRNEGCDVGVPCADGGVCAIDCACTTPTTTIAGTTSTTAVSTTTTTLPGGCNPLAAPDAQGCSAGQKCTWVTVASDPAPLGQLDCVPDGPVALGGSCTQGPPGEATGYDDCAAGLICVNGECRDVCGFDGSPNAACAVGDSCTRYAGLFANGEESPIAGACAEGCDPLTQLRTSGSPCPIGQGCYLLTSQSETISLCAAAGSLTHGQEIVGPAFANSCAPGHMPRRRDQNTLVRECGALCQMVDVYMDTNVASEGGVAPYTCASKGAALPDDAMNGESCRYYWAVEPFSPPSAFGNALGWCFKHAAFQYDSNGDQVIDSPYPRCITLTTGNVVPPIGNPPHSDAEYFWCTATSSQLLAPEAGPAKPLQLDRLDSWR